MADLSQFWMPHAHCVLRDWSVILPSVSFGTLTFLAYLAIPLLLLRTVLRHWSTLGTENRRLLVHAGGFIMACGVTHAMHAWNWFHADYRAEMASVFLTALMSVTFVLRIHHYLQNFNGPPPPLPTADVEDDIPFQLRSAGQTSP